MIVKKTFTLFSALVILATTVGVLPAGAAPLQSGFTRQIPSGGTTSFAAAAPSADSGIQQPEFAAGEEDSEGADAVAGDSHHGVDRSLSGATTGPDRAYAGGSSPLSGTMPAPGALITVGETTFARRVRAATVPVVVMFRSSRCQACRALGTNIARLADRYAGQLVVLSVDVDRVPLLAEQYGVSAVPTLLVLHHGDELTRMVGFAPEPLLRLFDQVVGGDLTPGMLWSPTEQAFEDALIVPLIDGWGWTYRRQVACPGRAGNPAAPGRVDVLVYDADAAAPLTLFEDKRQIASNAALQQAMLQARGYAQALRLASFVVAAPAGMWVYQLRDERARLMQSFSSLDVATHPEVVKHTLRWLQEGS